MRHMTLALVVIVCFAAGAWLVSRWSVPAVGARPAPEVAAITPSQVDAFLAPYQAQLQAYARPTLRVVLEEFPDDMPTASKVGGGAWWPAGEPAPVNAEGKPLVLLAQIDFAGMPPLPGYPTTGLLQFFISTDDLYGASMEGNYDDAERATQRNFRIVYWPDTSVPSQVLPMAATDQDYLPHSPERPLRMRFVRADEALSSGDYRFERMLGGNAYATVEAFAERHQLPADDFFNEVHSRLSGHGHKVGGYPGFAQTDPRTGGDWELLFQLDTDQTLGLMWGDAGVGNFFISPADLARADFSRVMYTWDCY